MSFLQKIWASDEPKKGPLDPFWYTFAEYFTESGAGIVVTPDSSMRQGVVYACVRAIAETVASQPLKLFRRREDGGKDPATEHPLYNVLHDKPNEWQTAFEFIEMMTGHAVLRHNAYAEIVPGRRGGVEQLIPIHPAAVRVEKLPNHRLQYLVRNEDTHEEDVYAQEEILHLRGISLDGMLGYAPTDAGRETIGIGMATEQHAARFFANDATPGGILRTDNALSDKAYSRLKASTAEFEGVFNAHKPRILEEGLQWQNTGLDPKVTQLIESRQLSAEDIARLFRIQPHVIGILARSTNNNIEQQAREFLTLTIQPWLCRWQQAISRSLIKHSNVYFAEFITESMLRGDTLSRYQVYQIGRMIEVLSANDIRLKENMNPIPGGDDYTNPNVKAAQLADNDKNATNSPNAEEEPAVDDDDDAEAAAPAWLPVMMESAVQRIANVQRQDVSRMLAKHDDDEPGFFAALEKFEERHTRFVAEALTPLAVAMQKSQLPAFDPHAAAGDVVRGLQGLSLRLDLTDWSSRRETEIKTAIWGTIA
jgi:HK97 family phage portal protein